METTITTEIEGKLITYEEFYQQARRWAAIVRNIAKSNSEKFKKGKKKDSHTYLFGKKEGKIEKKLKKSILVTVARNSGIPESISYKIPVHGIFREWGVGKGQPRIVGKAKSKRVRIYRTMDDWIDRPIEQNKEKLYNLAVEYYGDYVLINSFGAKTIPAP